MERTPASPAAVATKWERRAPLVLFALACAAYATTLGAGFTLDDVPLVRDNALVDEPGRWGDIFGTHYWWPSPWVADKSLYRPVTIGSYAFVHAALGVKPWAQHLVNVLLHGSATLLFFLWLRPLWKHALAAGAAAALFALHPIHAEAVAGIVGRAELLAFVGVFGSLCLLERARTESATPRALGWIAAAAGSWALALLSKESAVVAPLVLVWSEVVFPERRWLLRFAGRAQVALIAGLAALAGVWALRSGVVGPRWSHPGWDGVDAASRAWTALRVVGEYLALLAWPSELLAEYGVRDVPIATGIGEAVPALVALLALASLAVWARRRAPFVTFGLGLFALSLLPVSNLLLPIGVMKAERLLYLPSTGACIAFAAVLALLAERAPLRKAAIGVACAALLALAARTLVRNGDWQDNRTIALSIERISPNSPVLNTNLALWYQEKGQPAEARAALLKVLAEEPQNWQTHSFLGDVELELGDAQSARQRYETALKLAPGHPPLLIKHAQALVALEDWPAAAEALAKVRAAVPEEPAAWLNSIVVHVKLADLPRARLIAEEALKRFPEDPYVWGEASNVFAAQGDALRAREAAERSAELAKRR